MACIINIKGKYAWEKTVIKVKFGGTLPFRVIVYFKLLTFKNAVVKNILNIYFVE